MFPRIMLTIPILIAIAAVYLLGARVAARRAMDQIAAEALEGVASPERLEELLETLIDQAYWRFNLSYTLEQAKVRWGIAESERAR